MKENSEDSKKKIGGFKLNATYFLISLCLGVFLIEMFYEFVGHKALETMFYTLGFSLDNLLAGKWWTIITSIFMHANPEHLVLNMVALFFFGTVVENELGWKKTILIFFASAALGNVAVLFANLIGIMPSAIPTIGASSAVFGLLGTAMLVKPLEFMFFPFIVPVPLLLVSLIYIFINVAEFVVVLTAGGATDVAYAAHIGGLFSGMLFGFREEGKKKSIMVLIMILVLLVAIPVIWETLQYLEFTNYMNLLSGIFK